MPFSRLMPSGIVSASALAPRRLGALAAASLLIATAGGVLVAERGGQQRPAAPVIQARPLRILFLGSEAPPHASSAIYTAIAPVLARRGIQLTAALTPAEALDPQRLTDYDALLISGDHTTITPVQEKALIDFVESGKGVIAVHSAGAMFPSSDRYVSLIGGQWLRQTPGDFTVEMAQPTPPAFQGLSGFATSDELVVHTKQNTTNRTVLMERVDNGVREPVTWIRTQGKGRVFYTALGHDPKTWDNIGFQQLLERGVLYAVDDIARESWNQMTMPTVAYVEGFNVPNYENRDPAPKYQMPFTAPDSMKFITVPAEFSLELFASEPDIIKPISLNFDERGRLWIIEAIDYPNVVLNGAPGDDRITIVEDTDGDGKADKFTVFADDLSIPTSLCFANGGVIVAPGPDMLFLKDTDGDDKADVSAGALHRLGHHGHPRRAVEPAVRAGQLDLRHQSATPASTARSAASRRAFRQGLLPVQAGRLELEFLRATNNNSGASASARRASTVRLDRERRPSVYLPIPNRYYESVRGMSPSRWQHRRLPERGAVLPGASPRTSARSTGTAASPPAAGHRRSTRPGPTRRSTGTGPRSSPSRPATSSPRSRSTRRGPTSDRTTPGT